jgi:hypothetical protein
LDFLLDLCEDVSETDEDSSTSESSGSTAITFELI